jgi:uncharacterized membrane-anchored protein
MHLNRTGIIFAALFLLWSKLSFAQVAEDVAQKTWDEALAASTKGPAEVSLSTQAKLRLNDEMFFVPRAQGMALMRQWGNNVDDEFLGLVFPKADEQRWVITVDFNPAGYVKDDDAKTWNADELLANLDEGNKAQNEERIKLGIKPLDLAGWVQKPTYDSVDHKLVWSVKGVERGAPSDQPATINYNTYALGRDGYFQINLITDSDKIENEKRYAHSVIQSVKYLPGKRYADFDPATDYVAEYGLAALVGGVAAKKLGLFAAAGLFFAKFAKVILLAAAGIGAAVFKFFRRRTPE